VITRKTCNGWGETPHIKQTLRQIHLLHTFCDIKSTLAQIQVRTCSMRVRRESGSTCDGSEGALLQRDVGLAVFGERQARYGCRKDVRGVFEHLCERVSQEGHALGVESVRTQEFSINVGSLQQIEIFLYMHTYVDTHTKARMGLRGVILVGI